ncbi:MAG: NAD-dependent epimerase/dehydratase family protein [Chloroflexi bacterium]|nr:NAD-dependent epimerase/dehydratase family protein [Chloroflexota bacterium]
MSVSQEIDWAMLTGRDQPVLDERAVADALHGRPVVVTGAAGSLGWPLSMAIARAKPSRLVLLDWHESSLFRLRQALVNVAPDVPVQAVLGDVRDATRLLRVFAAVRPAVVFHLAAYKHVPWGEEDPSAFASVNVLGAHAVIGAATAAGVARIVYPSTDKAIDPPSLYGATKRLVEAQLRVAAGSGGPACTIVRFVNVLGSQGSAPETFARLIRQGEALSVTDPAMRRYWITPAHATLLLLHGGCLSEDAVIVAPDAGDEIEVMEIVRRLGAQIAPGKPSPEVRVTGARPGERLAEPLVAPHEVLERVPLPGLLAVRAIRSLDARAVGAAVGSVAHLLSVGATDDAVRNALFTDTWTLQ